MIAKETGLTRQTVYRMDDPASAEAALAPGRCSVAESYGRTMPPCPD
jgi:hypothetical protein